MVRTNDSSILGPYVEFPVVASFSVHYHYHHSLIPRLFLVKIRNKYRILENFRAIKLSRIGEKYNFCGENFCRLLTFAAPKDATPQILWRKLSHIEKNTVQQETNTYYGITVDSLLMDTPNNGRLPNSGRCSMYQLMSPYIIIRLQHPNSGQSLNSG